MISLILVNTDFNIKLQKKSLENDLTSDFCQVLEKTGKSIKVKLLTRTGILEDVIVTGSIFPKKDDTGIIIYVGKNKYPSFICINKNGTQGEGTVKYSSGSDLGESNERESAEIHLSDPKTWIQFDRTFAYLNYRAGSPDYQQWGTQYLEDRVKKIAEDWLFDKELNSKQTKLFLGDIAEKSGKKFHKSHHSGNEVDIYANSDSSPVEDTYNLQQIKKLLTIFKNNGVRYIFFNPKNWSDYSEFYSWVSNREKGHENHFHLRF